MQSTLDLEILRGTTFGPVQIVCKNSAKAPVALAGWSAAAQARKSASSTLIVDLLPVIAADDAAGLVTLSEIPWETTAALPVGDFRYDLVMIDPDGRRLPPFLGGKLKITDIYTHAQE